MKKIIDNRKNNIVEFELLPVGELFQCLETQDCGSDKDDYTVFMKVRIGNKYLAVNITNGNAIDEDAFEPNEFVRRLSATISVENYQEDK